MNEELYIYISLPSKFSKLLPRREAWFVKWLVTDASSIEAAKRSLSGKQLQDFEAVKPIGPVVQGRWLRNHHLPAITSVTREAVLNGKAVWVPEAAYRVVRSRESNEWIYDCMEQRGFAIIPPVQTIWTKVSATSLPSELTEYKRRLAKRELLETSRTQKLREVCDKNDILWRIAMRRFGEEEE